MENKQTYWVVCDKCRGQGKITGRLSKKVKAQYEKDLKQFELSKISIPQPNKPKASKRICKLCAGSGLSKSETPAKTNKDYPHVAIIGGGIGGVALAAALTQRGIPFTLYERDENFEARHQGYGLTLQQASPVLKNFGIPYLEDGIISTKHIVHDPTGKVIAEWGMRKWIQDERKPLPKKTNIHIARQSLRKALLKQAVNKKTIQWGHQLESFNENKDKSFNLNLKVNGTIKTACADLIVGADGIRSSVRKIALTKNTFPLNYLGCMVILGICKLKDLQNIKSDLLDSSTVFQTANGHERIYVMPFDSTSVMWQLSFPVEEEVAKKISSKGKTWLKQEAINRTQWHKPIPQILTATKEELISGYPVYDRELLRPENLKHCGNLTLIGDAAHPMSPFKGQGANQALLDALALAKSIYKKCNRNSYWKETGLRQSILNSFEKEILERSAVKVKDSASAAEFLHSNMVLLEVDKPRGDFLKKE